MYLKFTFTKCDAQNDCSNPAGAQTSGHTHQLPMIVDELPNVPVNTLIHSDINNQEYCYYLDCECEDKDIVEHAVQIYNDYVFDHHSYSLRFTTSLEEKTPSLVAEMKRDLIQASLHAERAKIDATSRRLRHAFYLFGGIVVASASVAVVNYIRENYQP